MAHWDEATASWLFDTEADKMSWEESEFLRNTLETNKEESISRFVIEDIKKREQTGVLRYGKYLTKHTTEDTLNHAYNEALDLAVYLRTEILKRGTKYDSTL